MKKSFDSHSPNLQNPNNVNLWVKKGVNVEDQRVTVLGESGATKEDMKDDMKDDMKEDTKEDMKEDTKEDQKEVQKANNNAMVNGEDVVADVVASSIFRRKLSL